MGLGLDFGGLQTFQHGGKNTSPLLSSNMSSHGGGTHNSGGNSMKNGVGIFGCGAFGQEAQLNRAALPYCTLSKYSYIFIPRLFLFYSWVFFYEIVVGLSGGLTGIDR